ncbi:MAG: DNA repair protein RecO [Geminicoccaceae bacterium]|nr:DNA repair protein RecO [Geminicoccaceae bacterium]
MEWRDEGIVLSRRALGERDALLVLFTPDHGRHLGIVKGGAGRRRGPLLQPGNRLEATWRARLERHLGQFDLEAIRLYPAGFLDRPRELAALASALVLLDVTLPERDPHPRLYAALLALLEHLAASAPDWPAAYVEFELLLLAELGFGLDLASCAVTGEGRDLAYVSPKTGRAVSRGAAGEWASRLLPLPAFLIGEAPAEVPAGEIAQGLRLAGHFLNRHIFEPADRLMPAPRVRFAGLWHPEEEDG